MENENQNERGIPANAKLMVLERNADLCGWTSEEVRERELDPIGPGAAEGKALRRRLWEDKQAPSGASLLPWSSQLAVDVTENFCGPSKRKLLLTVHWSLQVGALCL